MRIGYDIRPFLKQETGVGVYFKNLLFQLAEMDQTNEYFLFSSSWKDRFEPSNIPGFNKIQFRDLRWPVKAVNFAWYKLGWPSLDLFFKTDLDLAHSPTPLILPTKGKKVVTVCDLFFYEYPGKADREARKVFLKRAKKALQRADGVVTISQFTKKALEERFGLPENKVKVIYLGLNEIYKEAASPQELEKTKRKFGLPPEFLLFVGASEPRKNLLNLVAALKILHQKHIKIYLALVGRKGDDFENLVQRISLQGLQNWVKILGYLPEEELRNLYQLASVFVFPSYGEGFGLPLLEAMASGVPIAASGVSAIPEIAQEAALYFQPESPEDMAEKIGRLLKDENLSQELRARGKNRVLAFNWRKTAAETLGFYNSLLEKR